MPGFFTDFIWEHPAFDLEDALAVVWDDFPRDWREFWGLDAEHTPDHLDPDEWEEFQRLDRLARRLGRVARTLVRPGRLPEKSLTEPWELRQEAEAARNRRKEILAELKELLPEERFREIRWMQHSHGTGGVEAKHQVFRTAMQLIAVSQFHGRPNRLAERMLELLDYVTRTDSMRVQAYLGRVAECYVRGMAPEFAVMSRAVLEAAIENVFPAERAKGVLRLEDRERVSLSRHIDAARNYGFLDNDSEAAARRIKEAGDDAAHECPQLASEPEKILEDLVHVLEHLSAPEDGNR